MKFEIMLGKLKLSITQNPEKPPKRVPIVLGKITNPIKLGYLGKSGISRVELFFGKTLSRYT